MVSFDIEATYRWSLSYLSERTSIMRTVRPVTRRRRPLRFALALLASLALGFGAMSSSTSNADVADQAAVTNLSIGGYEDAPMTMGNMIIANHGCLPDCDTITYQWSRNGTPITGATNRSYELQPADAGQSIAVTVGLTPPGYDPVSTTSAAITPGKGDFRQAAVQILNTDEEPVSTMEVGRLIVADPTAYLAPYDRTTTSDDCTLAYQWYRNGNAIAGATAGTYRVAPDDLAQALSVRLTVSAPGYNDATPLSPTVAVTEGALSIVVLSLPSTTSPDYSHGPSYQFSYSAPEGSPLPTETWQWFRDGNAIAGATTKQYLTTSGDIGHQLTVQLTARLTGYTEAQRTSNPMTVQTGALHFEGPTLPATAQAGARIRAGVTYEGPVATFIWQWFRDGEVIAGATEQEYVTTSADAGHQLTVQLTVAAPGYTDLTQTSNPMTVADGAATISDLVIEAQNGTRVGIQVVAMHNYSPANATLTYQWYRGSSPISDATAQGYRLVAADLGQAITVQATVTAPGFAAATATSAAITPTAGVLTLQNLTLTSPINVGDSPKAGYRITYEGPAGLTPTLTWQWLRDGSPISGATEQSYKVTSDDRGRSLSVRLTAQLDGYADVTSTSASVTVTAWSVTLSGETITGSTDVLLTAGTEGPLPSGATVTYQWVKNGETISGATQSTYQAADDGAHPQFSVRVKVTTTDGASVTQTASTSPFGPPTLTELLARIIAMIQRILAMLVNLFR
jgi:hypothetical protein